MTKKIYATLAVSALFLASGAVAALPAIAAAPVCATIQGGTITDSAGNPIALGYDKFGYNYQAHMFNGTYDSSDRTLDGTYWGGTGDYVDDNLIMKWSDAWLSNKDCNGDGKLDRGANAGGTSQGWLTNQNEGDYDSDGNGTQDAHYTYFTKIVWVGPGGSLWGQYQTIQEVYNDPVGGFHGLLTKIGAPGFGLNDQWTTN
ncbi:MAG: hypothetical protein Q8Q46_02435 [Candidatus Giovannonibacteria bacterium]|nr:hypothetical protein [Candidatus Giovannonibacteria bacterium]